MRGQKILNRASALINSLGTAIPVGRELVRNTPTDMSSVHVFDKYDDAFDKRVDQLKPGAKKFYKRNSVNHESTDLMDRVDDVIANPTAFAGSTTAPYERWTGEDSFININPNASREIYAHELGHLASQQTDIGRLVSELRASPNLNRALLGSLMLAPGAAAVLNPGDDDMTTSLALASASMVPTLIDEGLATKNGLAIMDMAGQRATMGQRGRLAAGLLSYLAPALVMGYGGNVIGNLFDKEEQEKMIAN